MSPTNPETMTKGVMFLLQSLQVEGRDLDPVGQIPPLLEPLAIGPRHFWIPSALQSF